MEESLYRKWLDEEAVSLEELLLYHGIDGLLNAFENWLIKKGFVVKKP